MLSAGGLVTAVAPVVIKYNGAWVGWTGLDDFDFAKDVIPESAPDDVTPTAGLRSRQAVPVHVDRKLFDQVRRGSVLFGLKFETTLGLKSKLRSTGASFPS